MSVEAEQKFGIKIVTRPGARTLEQRFALVAGTSYLALGVVGFFVTGSANITEVTQHHLFGLFAINPYHNIVHLVLGALWLLAALALTPVGTEGVNLAIGGVYLLATVLGVMGFLTVLSITTPSSPVNILHLATGLVALLFAGPLRMLSGRPVGS